MNRRNRAFTLLELIIVISIILVLMGMVILGIRKIGESSRINATKVMMENGRSMVSEYGRAANALAVPSQPIAQDWLPRSLNRDDWQETPAPDANQLAADNTFPNARYGRMVLYSRAVMARLMQSPDVRKMVEAMPAEKLLAPRADLATTLAYSGAGTKEMLRALYSETLATDSGPHYYICSTTHADALNNRPRTGDQSPHYWLEVADTSPAPIDGFGNPMLLMPTCGFVANGRLVTSGGTFMISQPDTYWATGRTYVANRDYVVYTADGHQYQVYKCTTGHVSSAANAPTAGGAPWVRVATTPFFASAGPDGIFYDPARPETLDDNVYSFEN